jgi:hypothetical protein
MQLCRACAGHAGMRVCEHLQGETLSAPRVIDECGARVTGTCCHCQPLQSSVLPLGQWLASVQDAERPATDQRLPVCAGRARTRCRCHTRARALGTVGPAGSAACSACRSTLHSTDAILLCDVYVREHWAAAGHQRDGERWGCWAGPCDPLLLRLRCGNGGCEHAQAVRACTSGQSMHKQSPHP